MHSKNGFQYFYDRHERHWVLYPIDADGNRVEHDANDNPIESEYYVKKLELMTRVNNAKK